MGGRSHPKQTHDQRETPPGDGRYRSSAHVHQGPQPNGHAEGKEAAARQGLQHPLPQR